MRHVTTCTTKILLQLRCTTRMSSKADGSGRNHSNLANLDEIH